jgi:hypothetical protein
MKAKDIDYRSAVRRARRWVSIITTKRDFLRVLLIPGAETVPPLVTNLESTRS